MPRLFLKLFGTFWLTTVLILAISIFTSFRLADNNDIVQQWIDPREADVILQNILDDDGIPGLKRWLAEGESFPPGQTVYVVDSDGGEILDRTVPERLTRRLQRMWSFANRRDSLLRDRRPFDGRRRGFVPVLVAADGTRLLAVPGPAPLPRFGVFSRGAMRWVVLGLAAIMSMASFWLLSRSLSRPAQRIATTVGQLASGDMSARVGTEAYSNDEIGEIARQFDRMAGELESQALTRRELFRNISHELRAPLARLQIATELLGRKPNEAEKQLRRIRREIDVLEDLTGQVLALARVAQIENTNDVTNVVRVLDQVAANAEVEAGMKEITFNYHPPSKDARIAASEALLVSAIENVVRNAIQATPGGGEVNVDTQIGAGSCTVEVSDTGHGVPNDELEKIFEPFYRLDTNRPGSGIGLAITSRVLEQIGGAAEARNARAGGLIVSLTIPLESR